MVSPIRRWQALSSDTTTTKSSKSIILFKMSAFARGCLLRQQCPFQTLRTLHLPRSSHHPRFLSSTTALHAIKKARPSNPLKVSLPKTKPSIAPTQTTPITYQSYAASLAQKSHPTLIYEAPSHTLFIFSSYSASFFCFSYAAFSFLSHYIDAPVDIATWVPYAFGGISFMMAGFGGWLMLGPAGLIRSISAVPSVLTQAGKLATGNSNAAKAANPELKIEVTLRKMFPLPFFPARVLTASPSEISLRHPLFIPRPPISSAEELRHVRIQEEAARKQQLEYEQSHIMSAPFRHMNIALFNLFKGLGRAWSREGFLKVEVKGKLYKLDISGGWALDGGRALDRLVGTKPRL